MHPGRALAEVQQTANPLIQESIMSYQLVGAFMIGSGTAIAALGGFLQWYGAEKTEKAQQAEAKRERDADRAEAARLREEDRIRHEAELAEARRARQDTANAAALSAERQRRSAILGRIRLLWLDRDGVTSAELAGTVPMPKSFVDAQLAKMGETWRQDVYY